MSSKQYDLTDFQKATADRIFQIFHDEKQNRVLLADEVGLGKTIVASEVIDKVMKWHISEGDDLFKVVYICSNEAIAHQNESKLGIARDAQVSITESRLTMQHLQIAKKDVDFYNEKKDYQLLPMTPSTSLDLKSGRGTVQERALMFCILKELEEFSKHPEKLDKFFLLDYNNEYEWEKQKRKYQEQIDRIHEIHKDKYPENLFVKLHKKLKDEQFKDFMNCFQKGKTPNNKKLFSVFVPKLRQIFAEISLDELKADLIIMDEFQRFNSLIKSSEEYEDSELGKLCHKIFNSKIAPNKNKELKTKILLLSATPYKPYSTLAEAMEKNSVEQNDHFKDFKKVIRFLYNDRNSGKNFDDFEFVWSAYSNSLQELRSNDWSVIIANKKAAEKKLCSVLSRTERGNNSSIKTPSLEIRENLLNIKEEDIQSYINVCKYTQLAGLPPIPVEYAKSSPYLLSFMRDHYKIYNDLQKKFSGFHSKISFIQKDKTSFLNYNVAINAYKKIPTNNARLQALYDEILPSDKNTELLLWVPPSHPYYSTTGKNYPVGDVFEKNKGFSKLLLFSAWEMVPRMTAAMTSYEAERRVFSKIKKYSYDKVRDISAMISYDSQKELLEYPSDFLADMYQPSKFEGRSLSEILEKLKVSIQQEKDKLKNNGYELINSNKRSSAQVLSLLKALEGKTNPKQNECLIIPDDAVEILSYMAVASPAVCTLRTLQMFNKKPLSEDPHDIARRLAHNVILLFNKPIAQSIVKLAFKDSKTTNYIKLLRYCAEGNFQAMLDEYAFVCIKSDQFIQNMASQKDDYDEENDENVDNVEQAVPFLRISSGSVTIDTKESFRRGGNERKKRQKNMRTSFAIGYCNLKQTDKTILRTDDIRTAFNMPFRPFVLSTTSIGQEGLDFHSYCRKIMHWNLPSNPIDLEQREGRINRYMSLAIRQSLANSKYANNVGLKDFWNDLINNVKEGKDVNDLKGGMIPCWILPNDEEFENPQYPIERIVPMYPYSKDQEKYNWIIKVLSMYRLTLGQPNQEELLRSLDNANIPKERLEELFFNLSPFFGNREGKTES